MSAFDVLNRATWPDILSLEEIAAIYKTTPLAIRHALKPSSKVVFPLTPCLRHPARFRKVDVIRHLEGGRKVA